MRTLMHHWWNLTSCNGRTMSTRGNMESSRQALMEMASQIRSVSLLASALSSYYSLQFFVSTMQIFHMSYYYLLKLHLWVSVCCACSKYDPYPCILGIPIMPALFMTSKFYIFISFALIGTRMMITIFKSF
jgi:hypothetical protein